MMGQGTEGAVGLGGHHSEATGKAWERVGDRPGFAEAGLGLTAAREGFKRGQGGGGGWSAPPRQWSGCDCGEKADWESARKGATLQSLCGLLEA